MSVRTQCVKICLKTIEGQYCSVRLKKARLVSSLSVADPDLELRGGGGGGAVLIYLPWRPFSLQSFLFLPNIDPPLFIICHSGQ